jgi:hypothetical protein
MGMVSKTDGMRIKCPACSNLQDRGCPDNLYKEAAKAMANTKYPIEDTEPLTDPRQTTLPLKIDEDIPVEMPIEEVKVVLKKKGRLTGWRKRDNQKAK